jgi:CRP-like cAMP-binding protein
MLSDHASERSQGPARFEPFLRKLSARDALSAAEISVLNNAPARPRRFDVGEDLVSEGTKPSESCLLLEGVCARYNILSSGKRQITAIHVPGDFVDLHSLLLERMDHGVAALTTCQAVYVQHEYLIEIIESQPRLGRLLWKSTLIDAAIHRQWLVAMGARQAFGHMAHLFCELFLKLRAVGLTVGFGFPLAITQEQMGDALGLSVVHTNRTLKELREADLLTWHGREVTIMDWPGLQRAADFDATYLSLPGH